MNLIQELEKEQVAKLSAGKDIPDFATVELEKPTPPSRRQ